MNNLNSRKTWSLALLLVLVIFLILALVLVYLNWKSNSEEITPIVSNPDNYQIPMGVTLNNQNNNGTATNDPTVDWLEFKVLSQAEDDLATTSTSTLFSFKYPAVFKVEELKNYLVLDSDTVTSTQLNIGYQKSSKNLVDFIKELDKTNATGYEGQPSVKITTSTDKVTIAGTQAVFREQKLLAADLNQYVIYFKLGDNIYSISLNAPILDQNLFNFFALFVNNFKISQ